ncbi:MAG TPA: hypothetical protein VMT66_06470 [Steroidobacteraceae bacterium]|nr:hypothetical protein [Steroidobacteraceae bacterium]
MLYTERRQLLGGHFWFETDSARLLRLVRLAYARLPAHRFPGPAPRLRVRLMLTPAERSGHARRCAAREPPAVRTLAAGGILCGALQGATLAAIVPQQRAALIVIPGKLLRYPYHLRYELLEFAVYVLAARVQKLLPLHAACVGRNGEGILLVGPSGSGKSTLVAQCLLAGLDFLAEDSVLVRPEGLRATGVPNFVHLRPDSLHFLARRDRARLLRASSPIRRRSGVEKLEIDVRGADYRLAAPLRVRAVAFLSARGAGAAPLLRPLRRSVVRRRLISTQRYAAEQPGWSRFMQQLDRLPAYELRRGAHPRDSVEALQELLSAGAARPASR